MTGTPFELGTYVLFAVLCGAASYIAVPAVQRLAIPEASPTLPLAASLGLTFSYNVTIGIPVYIEIAKAVDEDVPVGCGRRPQHSDVEASRRRPVGPAVVGFVSPGGKARRRLRVGTDGRPFARSPDHCTAARARVWLQSIMASACNNLAELTR